MIRHCSPTLAGMKTGSLFTCPCDSREELCSTLRQWNTTLSGKGLRVIPLKFSGSRALIYVYRPARLSLDLENDTARGVLRRCGYGAQPPDRCIVHLAKRIQNQQEFPHEIGLFLGYPPEDVVGFIENKAGCCKCVGCWKVYGDEDAARKTFAKYKKCTRVYCQQYAKGKTVERLTVADR